MRSIDSSVSSTGTPRRANLGLSPQNGAWLSLGALAVLTSACYNYRSIPIHSPGPANIAKQEVVWATWWGLKQQSPKIDNCRIGSLHEVTVRRNFLHTIVTVVTLGAASPAIVEWRCAKAAGSGGVDAPAATRAATFEGALQSAGSP